MTFPNRTIDTSRDYKMPPKDMTVVKCQIVRGAWVNIDGKMQAVKPGQILQIPRWLANELSYCGQASLL